MIQILFLLLLTLTSTYSTAYALELPTLEVNQVSSSRSYLELDTVLSPAPMKGLRFQISDSFGKTYETQSKTLPMHLAILVDQSSLCKTHHVDDAINQILPKLKETLNSNSILSVVTFSSDNREILLNRSPINEIKDIQIRCSERSLSSSYENALQLVFNQETKNNLPLSVWVFSSGNVSLSQETAKQISEHDATIQIALYEPLVKNQIQPMIEASQKLAGPGRIRTSLFSSQTQGGPSIPELKMKIKFSAPAHLAGLSQSLKLSAVSKQGENEETLASLSFQALLPHTLRSQIYQWIGKTGVLLLAVLVFLAMGWVLLKIYSPRRCKECSLLMRHSQKFCLFCTAKAGRYWMIQTPGSSSDSLNQIIPYTGDQFTFYKTRYGISHRGRRKNAIARVQRKSSNEGDIYQIFKKTNRWESGKSHVLSAGETFEINSVQVRFIPESTGSLI